MMPSGLMVVTVVETWWWGGMREMETGQQVPHPGSPLCAFVFAVHNKQSCCYLEKKKKKSGMPGRYRQPSTLALLSPSQLSRLFLPVNKWNTL